MLWDFLYNSSIVVSIFFFGLSCYIFLSAIRIRYHVYLGRKLAKEAKPFSRLVPKDHRELRILIMGDSTAVGVGASRPEHSIAGRLGIKFPNAEIINTGRTGATTGQVLKQFRRIEGKFDLILVNTGSNDVLWGVSQKLTEKHLRKLLSNAKKISPRILVTGTGDAGILPFLPSILKWYFAYRTQLLQHIFANETRSAGPSVRFVELFRTECDRPFLKNPREHFAYDLAHPNDAGYAALFTCIELVLSSGDWVVTKARKSNSK